LTKFFDDDDCEGDALAEVDKHNLHLSSSDSGIMIRNFFFRENECLFL